ASVAASVEVTSEIVEVGDGVDESDLIIHQPRTSNPAYASILAQMAYPTFPTPFGILRQIEGRETYEDALHDQIKSAQAQGVGNLQELLTGKSSWVVE
ncbi:MAG: 2-oxoacid:ferredoxin oxidoreductase subunit beta, partial [Opitutae bacterium]